MVTKKERSRTLFKGIIKSKKTSPAQKTAARKNLAKLGGKKRTMAKKKSSRKRSNPRTRGTFGQVGQFFGLGRRLGTKAAQTKFVQNAVINPAMHAAAGAGYAGFEAVILPIAMRLKASQLNIPVGASQVFGAWLLAMTPMKFTKAVGLEGIGIETYSMVSQLQILKTLRQQSAQLLGRALGPVGNNGGNQ